MRNKRNILRGSVPPPRQRGHFVAAAPRLWSSEGGGLSQGAAVESPQTPPRPLPKTQTATKIQLRLHFLWHEKDKCGFTPVTWTGCGLSCGRGEGDLDFERTGDWAGGAGAEDWADGFKSWIFTIKKRGKIVSLSQKQREGDNYIELTKYGWECGLMFFSLLFYALLFTV